MDYALLSGEPKEKETPLLSTKEEAPTLLSKLQTWFEYLFSIVIQPPQATQLK